MLNRIFHTLIILLLSNSLVFGQSAFKTYEGDPLNLKETSLSNGMKVFLVENHDKPEISGSFVVNVGSKNDPADNTGMAHYLEHMLFKGTQTLGTIDFEKEKVYLDEINNLYDQLAKETELEKRNSIQKKINEASNKAAQYALPNEFDRIIAEMGGTKLNAFTSADMTVYLNVFPPNQIEKWLDVYVHRFENPVFRLFQSELETVYEEKNRSMNEPINSLFEYFLENFYEGHPYGDQTTLGKTEHLKNPSLSTMYSYFYKYYVPNNMALVLVGDFDSETILPIIKEKLNQLPYKALEDDDNFPLKPFEGRKTLNVKSSPIKISAYGYRVDGTAKMNYPLNDVLTELLTNDTETGLLDELRTSGEVMGTMMMNIPYNDYGALVVVNIPKLIGQSFEEAEALLFAKFDSLKSGGFKEETLESIKNGLLKQKKLSMETNEEIAYGLYEYFISGKDWNEIINYDNQLESITKADVVAYAKTVFVDNYLALYSKMGSTKKDKIQKPERDPVVSKSIEKSEYYKTFLTIKEQPLAPVFIDFSKDISSSELSNNGLYVQTRNPKNNIFDLTFRWSIGNYNNASLTYLAAYLNRVGTNKTDFVNYRKEIQKLNASYYFYADEEYFYLEINGEDEKLDQTIDLVNDLVQGAAVDNSKIKELIEEAKTELKFEKSSPGNIVKALREYAIYGEESTYLKMHTAKEVAKITPQNYLALFEDVKTYPLTVHYTGNNKEAKLKINQIFKVSASQKVEKSILDRKEIQRTENIIYFINQKRSTQANIHFDFPVGTVPKNEYYKLNAFNEYFGKGMSSLVFQEIREFRSLAYASFGFCRPAPTPENNTMFNGYVGCQNDKTIEAMQVMLDLINNMPEKPERIDYIKGATIRSSLTSVPGFRNLISQIEKWQDAGFNQDPRLEFQSNYENLSFNDILEFYQKYLKGKPVTISIVGDKKQIDLKQLEKFGEIIHLKTKDVYVE